MSMNSVSHTNHAFWLLESEDSMNPGLPFASTEDSWNVRCFGGAVPSKQMEALMPAAADPRVGTRVIGQKQLVHFEPQILPEK
jgi:hypothetical protein